MQRLILSVAAVVAAGSSYAASVKWQPTYAMAMSMAAKSHKLVMVDFYTDWCGWCKKLDSDTYATAAIATKAQDFVPVKVNAEREGIAQAKKYKVTGFPTILFLKANGEVAWKIVGYMPPTDFAKQMDMAKGVTTEFPWLQKQFKANQLDPVVDSKLLGYYSGLGDLANVEKVLAGLGQCTQKVGSSALGTGYNAAGDAFQAANKTKEAESAFEKAEALGKPDQIVYARISLAECYMGDGDKQNAAKVLKALDAMGPEADLYRKTAKAMLASIEKS